MIKKILLTAILIGVGYLLISNSAPSSQPSTSKPTTGSATMTIDTGSSPATYSATLSDSATALSLLEQVAVEQDFPLETKKYDFGTLVHSINNFNNSPTAAWIYFINGQSATQGADQYPVQPGDHIEWRYTTPN